MNRSLVLLTFVVAVVARAQTTKSTTIPTPTADYELREWAIFLAEPLSPRANSVGAVKSTLPSFVVSRRADAQGEERNTVMPMGVIRIVGGKTPSPKFDVLLNIRSGEFQGHWPKAENNRPSRLLWSNLTADDSKPTLSQVDEKHWMTRLREGDSRYLTAGRDTRGERFLLYDPEPAFVVPLHVEASSNGYRVANASAFETSTLELYKSKPDGWHKAFAQTLGASRAASKPSTQSLDVAPPKIKAGDTLSVAFDYAQNVIAERQRIDKVSDSGDFVLPMFGSIRVTGKTTEQLEVEIQTRFGSNGGIGLNKVTVTLQPKEDVSAATGPTGLSADLALSTETFSDPKALLSPWKDRLSAAGVGDVDVAMMLEILNKYAIDAGRLTAVYMLDRDRMDELLPEEVVPQPAKVTRVGLVIVRNIDPDINNEIAQLIKQLGDDEWSQARRGPEEADVLRPRRKIRGGKSNPRQGYGGGVARRSGAAIDRSAEVVPIN